MQANKGVIGTLTRGVIKPLTRAKTPVLFEMMRLIRKDRSFFIFRKPEQNDIDLTNKMLQTKFLTIDTGVFMKHYLENIDEVCRDVKTGVDGVSDAFDGGNLPCV